MFLATDSQKTYMTTTMTMPTVFSTKSDPVQPLETVNPRFADSGSSSETDTDEDDESEDNEDTIVRWGWVWYKGEMRRVGEIPEMDRCNLEHVNSSDSVSKYLSNIISRTKIYLRRNVMMHCLMWRTTRTPLLATKRA